MPQSTSEAISCLSDAEFERNRISEDDSELLRPDGTEIQCSLPPQYQDEYQTFQSSVSHTASLETVTRSRTSNHPIDGLKIIPRSLSFSWWSFATDAISILVTVPFIVLGFLLAHAKGQIVEEDVLHNLENGVRVAATALPFVFAAIFGRLTAQVARWKLERGGSLPSIEQWLGSRTLFSAFLTQVNMGGLNLIGVSMMVAWALSPLGAQSILRVMGTGSRDVKTNGSVTYFDTNTPSTFTAISGDRMNVIRKDLLAVMNSMYAASLTSADSIKSSGQDLWGNIKVPYVFPHADSLSGDAWVRIPDDGSVEFSSLVGLPIAVNTEPVPGLKSTFTMESSHIQLQCSPFVTTGAMDGGWINYTIFKSYANTSLSGPSSNLNSCSFPKAPKNGTFQAITRSGDSTSDSLPWILALDTFVDPLWQSRMCDSIYAPNGGHYHFDQYSPATFADEKGIFTSEAKLQLLAWTESDDMAYSNPLSTTCGVAQSWVESRVDCNWSISPACAVTAQRPSQKQHASSNITHLSFPTVFTRINTDLPGASGLKYVFGLPDASLIYLVNTSSSYIFSQRELTNTASLDNLTGIDIGRRLGQLINTYLMISQGYDSISTGSLKKDQFNDVDSAINNITTTIWSVKAEDIYTINTAWLAAFFVTAIAMLVGSIVGAVFCHSSITPEILGFASAAIRDSKHIDLAPGFGALGGLEMTKAFEGIEFRYGVVNKSESGQEALGVSWKVSAQRVKKRVPYV